MQIETPPSRALLALALMMPACSQEPPRVTQQQVSPALVETRSVAGSAVHFFTTAIVHSQTNTEDGKTQRSTEIVKLAGNLEGYVLYQPTSVFDFTAGTLVNTGRQYFSGTVLGGDPVILYDDAFRFDVNLAAGTEHGTVHLRQPQDAGNSSWYECDLDIEGTGGRTPGGEGIVDYTGECRRYDAPRGAFEAS